MRNRILNFLRVHPLILNIFWKLAHVFFLVVGMFVPIKEKTILITSFAGRKYDDSPKALYEEILKRPEFKDWEIIWAFVEPDKFNISKGKKITIDTWAFFMALLYSRVWISNSGMDRNIGINRKGTIKVETWHGTPMKKIGIDQNSGTLGNYKPSKKLDRTTIRCAQSEYDRDIFARVFNADKNCFLLCDLPRNDELTKYTCNDILNIKMKLGIPVNKRVLLYMPTYREYLINEKKETYLAPPIDLKKWERELGKDYILLVRVHYAVSTALNILKEKAFVQDVSDYPYINDLYAVADILISDYSSAFFDYSIFDRPMLCFAYDEKEYAQKRGLYSNLKDILPCPVEQDEDSIIKDIQKMNYSNQHKKTMAFHKKFAPYAGHASEKIIDSIIKKVIL